MAKATSTNTTTNHTFYPHTQSPRPKIIGDFFIEKKPFFWYRTPVPLKGPIV